MKFKYSEYPGPDGSKIFRPTVPIVFKAQPQFIQTEAIIDSGADYTILPIAIAKFLDIDLDLNAKMVFYGAGNNPFSVYVSPVEIEHVLRQSGFRPLQWKTKVFFAENESGILLGQKGFFDRFKVAFDGRKRTVEISR